MKRSWIQLSDYYYYYYFYLVFASLHPPLLLLLLPFSIICTHLPPPFPFVSLSSSFLIALMLPRILNKPICLILCLLSKKLISVAFFEFFLCVYVVLQW
uniref:Uncharacterized protein n=1 Tax=Manihot esculenta TaxID=3983 RepID=A0A2C9TZK5_MANES